jgi:hypothetical protein
VKDNYQEGIAEFLIDWDNLNKLWVEEILPHYELRGGCQQAQISLPDDIGKAMLQRLITLDGKSAELYQKSCLTQVVVEMIKSIIDPSIACIKASVTSLEAANPDYSPSSVPSRTFYHKDEIDLFDFHAESGGKNLFSEQHDDESLESFISSQAIWELGNDEDNLLFKKDASVTFDIQRVQREILHRAVLWIDLVTKKMREDQFKFKKPAPVVSEEVNVSSNQSKKTKEVIQKDIKTYVQNELGINKLSIEMNYMKKFQFLCFKRPLSIKFQKFEGKIFNHSSSKEMLLTLGHVLLKSFRYLTFVQDELNGHSLYEIELKKILDPLSPSKEHEFFKQVYDNYSEFISSLRRVELPPTLDRNIGLQLSYFVERPEACLDALMKYEDPMLDDSIRLERDALKKSIEVFQSNEKRKSNVNKSSLKFRDIVQAMFEKDIVTQDEVETSQTFFGNDDISICYLLDISKLVVKGYNSLTAGFDVAQPLRNPFEKPTALLLDDYKVTVMNISDVALLEQLKNFSYHFLIYLLSSDVSKEFLDTLRNCRNGSSLSDKLILERQGCIVNFLTCICKDNPLVVSHLKSILPRSVSIENVAEYLRFLHCLNLLTVDQLEYHSKASDLAGELNEQYREKMSNSIGTAIHLPAPTKSKKATNSALVDLLKMLPQSSSAASSFLMPKLREPVWSDSVPSSFLDQQPFQLSFAKSTSSQSPPLGKYIIPEKTHGISNRGNTCFANTSLQILAYLPDVYLLLKNYHERIVDSYESEASRANSTFSVKLIELLWKLWYVEDRTNFVSEIDNLDRCYFKKHLDFRLQNDSNEFMSVIFQLLEVEMLLKKKIRAERVDESEESDVELDLEKLLRFKTRETFRCECGFISSNLVDLVDLSAHFLPLESANSWARSNLRLENMIVMRTSLQKDCEKCRKLESHNQVRTLVELPSVIRVALLRTGLVENYTNFQYDTMKITDFVAIPLEFDVSPFLDADVDTDKYELVGVIVCDYFNQILCHLYLVSILFLFQFLFVILFHFMTISLFLFSYFVHFSYSLDPQWRLRVFFSLHLLLQASCEEVLD